MKMLSVNKSFLSSRATEALNTETGRRTIERVLLRLGCTHAIFADDLKIFRKWSDIDNEHTFQRLLQLYQEVSIIDTRVESIQGSESIVKSNPTLDIIARMHMGESSGNPSYCDFKYVLLYLLPVENVSLIVRLRSALLAQTTDLIFPVACSFRRSGLSSFIEISRAGACWGQISIEPKEVKVLENRYCVASLAPIQLCPEPDMQRQIVFSTYFSMCF
jgi:hypothetical protein